MATSKGLMQQWGVEAPKAGANDKQSKDFSEAFNPGIKAVGEDITALTDIAMAEDLKKLRERNENLVTAYQKVRRGIDPANPEKAKKEIKKVLQALDKLEKQSGQKRKEVETANQEWLSYQAQAEDQLSDQVDALEAWGDERAPLMLEDLAEIDGAAQSHDWNSAKALLMAFAVSLKPVHEAYLKQKAAKAIYDIDRPPLDQRIDDLAAFETPIKTTDEDLKSIINARAGVDSTVEELDFVTANAELKKVASNVDYLESFMAEITAEKAAFEKRRTIVETDLTVAAGERWHGLDDELKDLQATAKEVDDLAKISAYFEASEKMGPLEKKVADFMTKAREQMSDEELYRARNQALQTRYAAVDDAPPNNRGKGFQQFIGTGRSGLEERVRKSEFTEALVDLVKVEAELVACENYMVEHAREKADYVARNGAASQCCGKFIEPAGEEMTTLHDAIKANRTDMEKFATELEYTLALDNMEALESQIAEYEGLMTALAEDKAAYDALRLELDPKIKVCSEVIDGDPGFAYVDDVTAKVGAAEGVAADKHYQFALGYLMELKEILTMAEQVRAMWAEKSAACEARFAELKKPLDEAMAPIEGDEGAALQKAVETPQTEARNWYESGSYQAALDSLVKVEGALAEIEAFRTRQADERKLFDERHKPVKARLDEIHGETGDDKVDALMIGAIERLVDAETAAGEAKFDIALNHLHGAATAAESLAVARQDFEAEKKRYEDRKKTLDPRITEAMKPVYRDWAADKKTEVEKLVSENATLEESARFDQALANQDTIESNLATLKVAHEQDAAKPLTKDKLEEAVADKLAELEPKIDGILALPDSVVDKKDKARLKEWRDSAVADSTLGALEDAYAKVQQMEALLAGCEIARTRYEEAKAEYDKRATPLEPKISAIVTVTEDEDHYLFHQAEPAYFAGAEMLNFAKAEDYPKALAAADRVEALMGAYDNAKLANEQQEAAYKQRIEPLTKPLHEALSASDGPWAEAVKTDMKTNKETMEGKAGLREFDQALLAVGKLEPLLARYKTLAEQQGAIQADYERRLPVVLDRLVQAQSVPMLEGAESSPEFFSAERADMEEAAGKGNYQEALAFLEGLEDGLDAYQVILDERDKLAEDNKARLETLDKRLARLEVWEGALNDKRKAVADLITQARKTASPVSCAALLDRTEAKMDGYEDAVHQIQAQRQDFDARYDAIIERVDTACTVKPAKDWKHRHETLVQRHNNLIDIAERGGYDHAVVNVASLAEVLAECEVFIKRDQKKAA